MKLKIFFYFYLNGRLELFHVVKKPKIGGVSLLLDGFYCANQLKKECPEDFDFLTK